MTHKFPLIPSSMLILFTLSTPTQAFTASQTDKAAHFGLSSVGVEVLIKGCPMLMERTQFWNCHAPASITVFTLGLLKELSDAEEGGSFDLGDMTANSLGILTGNLLQWRF